MTGDLSEQDRYRILLTARLVPHRPIGREIFAAAILLAIVWLFFAMFRNPAFEWPVFEHYFFHRDVMLGLLLSLWLTAAVSILGFALGTLLALMRLSGNPVLRNVSAGYVWLFRSVPVLVQLLFWYNIGFIIPSVTLGVPLTGHWMTIDTRDLVSAIGAAMLGLSFSEAAHAAEIVRGGILSVHPGTIEAAKALGLSSSTITRRIILPQAIPTILPSAGNLVIGMLKGTSIVSVIAVSDLLYSVQLLYNDNYKIVPLLMVATVWYIVVTTLLTIAQGMIERRFAPQRQNRSHPKPAAAAESRIAGLEGEL